MRLPPHPNRRDEDPMASEVEIRLGRLVVKRGLATEEQLLQALRQRNQAPGGPDLGQLLVQKGLLTPPVLAALQRDAAEGKGQVPAAKPARHEVTTDHQINLGSAREAIARECLDEALANMGKKKDEAVKELARLAAEFADTESGNRAKEVLRAVGKA
jgi:hypothetical protein